MILFKKKKIKLIKIKHITFICCKEIINIRLCLLNYFIHHLYKLKYDKDFYI